MEFKVICPKTWPLALTPVVAVLPKVILATAELAFRLLLCP